MKKINIAIDGPVASGKSTIAKKLAQTLGYIHIDTGAMYRCVAYKALTNNIDMDDEIKLTELTKSTLIRLTNDDRVYCDNVDVTQAIRSNEVSTAASRVSVFSGVRKELVKQQQAMALDNGVVMDGRDIGTVVLPDAQLKIFQTASVASRANRRYQENKTKKMHLSFEQLAKEINERDFKDTHRIESPLKQADDAIVIDTSNLNIEEVIAKIETEIEKVMCCD
jgi:cytidylate kinase